MQSVACSVPLRSVVLLSSHLEQFHRSSGGADVSVLEMFL
jgi:hypothetical protein